MNKVAGFLSIAVALSGCAVLPEPLSDIDVASLASNATESITAGEVVIDGPVTLYQAMSHALRSNLDQQVKQRETALRARQLELSHYSMLPTAAINAGFTDRNNYSGGCSRRLPIGTGPITADTPSTSSERDVFSADLALSWNILDFGLSYVRARQASDRVLIARENQRKVVNRIVEDVRTIYWRAVTAQRLVAHFHRLANRVERALSDTQSLSNQSHTSPLSALNSERELVEIKREIQRLSGELAVAKLQLAALMNIRPGTQFRVEIPARQSPPPYLGLAVDEMVARALERRPEMLEVAYEKRINHHEARVALLELLPSLGANAGPNWNSNALLFNQHFVSWGAQASWNLLKVFAYPARQAELDARDDLLRARTLAVTMAVMTQVHVARVRLIHARRRHHTARHFMSVQARILRQIRSALDAGKVSEQTAIREEMNTLVARVKMDLAYVDLQNAYGAAYAAMGVNPFARIDVDQGTFDDLATSLHDGWRALGSTASNTAEKTPTSNQQASLHNDQKSPEAAGFSNTGGASSQSIAFRADGLSVR